MMFARFDAPIVTQAFLNGGSVIRTCEMFMIRNKRSISVSIVVCRFPERFSSMITMSRHIQSLWPLTATTMLAVQVQLLRWPLQQLLHVNRPEMIEPWLVILSNLWSPKPPPLVPFRLSRVPVQRKEQQRRHQCRNIPFPSRLFLHRLNVMSLKKIVVEGEVFRETAQANGSAVMPLR